MFDESFPLYLHYGMTYEQFWEGNPYLTRAYYQAHKFAIEERNQELWLQGLYIYNAFGANLQNLFRKSGGRKAKYIDKPLQIFPKSEEQQKAEVVETRNKVIEYFNRMKQSFDAKQKKGKV